MRVLLLATDVLLDHFAEVDLLGFFKARRQVQFCLDLFGHVLTFNRGDSCFFQVFACLGLKVGQALPLESFLSGEVAHVLLVVLTFIEVFFIVVLAVHDQESVLERELFVVRKVARVLFLFQDSHVGVILALLNSVKSLFFIVELV